MPLALSTIITCRRSHRSALCRACPPSGPFWSGLGLMPYALAGLRPRGRGAGYLNATDPDHYYYVPPIASLCAVSGMRHQAISPHLHSGWGGRCTRVQP